MLLFLFKKIIIFLYLLRYGLHSIAPIFVENIGRFGKLKIIGLDQVFLKIINNYFGGFFNCWSASCFLVIYLRLDLNFINLP